MSLGDAIRMSRQKAFFYTAGFCKEAKRGSFNSQSLGT